MSAQRHRGQPPGAGALAALDQAGPGGCTLSSQLSLLAKVQGSPPRSILLGASQALDKCPKGCPGGRARSPLVVRKGSLCLGGAQYWLSALPPHSAGQTSTLLRPLHACSTAPLTQFSILCLLWGWVTVVGKAALEPPTCLDRGSWGSGRDGTLHPQALAGPLGPILRL